MRYLGMGILTLLSLSFSLQAREWIDEIDTHEANIIEDILDHVSPLGKVNRYDLLLTLGMDDVLDEAPVVLGAQGFQTYFGWDQTQIDAFRNAAITYYLERFGIDFTNGYYDAPSGTVSNAYATLVPISFEGKYRVLASNNFNIPAYTRFTPSKVVCVEYVVFFNGNPYTYGGTYADGQFIEGKQTHTLSYACYKITTGLAVKHDEYFFMRCFYPGYAEALPSTPQPNRTFEKVQLFSTKYGSGFGVVNGALPLAPDENGKYPSYVRNIWTFPGSFEIEDWNGFTEAPIVL